MCIRDRDYSLNPFDTDDRLPHIARIGFIDGDSYPDLMLILSPDDDPDPRVYVYENEMCTPNKEGEIEDPNIKYPCGPCIHKRVFRPPLQEALYSRLAVNKTLYAGLFDLDEKGKLDIIAVTRESRDTPSRVVAFFNYLNFDSTSLKAMGLNGAGSESFGTPSYGMTIQCVITELRGAKRVSTYPQLSQTAFTALQPPFSLIGLGRTNNFVENLNIGLSTKDKHFKSWTPIVPNSQVVITPFSTNPDKWTLENFISPTKQAIIVISACVLMLIILGVAILYLHWKEQKEDQLTDDQQINTFVPQFG
eukprot:TRINITY_DN4228_c0_g4_i1.p1 TRINITY_DN4228_c0_g4~~TRINITY_DN4228_c0_g4_i1.p1  ORF type:complete len:306 (-),score=55.40 TRINITY_DN4228_c0_g4_i1:38-955(-)